MSKKISALTAATLPLTGAELLPLAIASVDDYKISFANLTAQVLQFGLTGNSPQLNLNDVAHSKTLYLKYDPATYVAWIFGSSETGGEFEIGTGPASGGGRIRNLFNNAQFTLNNDVFNVYDGN